MRKSASPPASTGLPSGNNLELEGVDDNERTGLLQVLIPPQEAIQTVDISTSNFDAELGRATGGAVNLILKSGSNEFHGSAYESNRVSALAARSCFDSARGHFTYNYFGGTIGGPIIARTRRSSSATTCASKTTAPITTV